MADLPDVTTALGVLIGNGLYPTAPTSAAQPSPVVSAPVRVERGWPNPQALDAAMKAGSAIVSIYPLPGERVTTRYERIEEQSGPIQPVTWLLNQNGQTISVGGQQPTPFYGQNFAAFINGIAYVYRSTSEDTQSSIAAALCALIQVDIPSASVSGPTITLPDNARIGALRLGSQAPTQTELKRQERQITITVWSPNPDLRDALGSVIDVLIGQTDFLQFASDGSYGRMLYRGSPFSDFDQKQGVYRRDIVVSVEYATIASDTAAQAIAIKTVANQEGADGSTIQPPLSTTYT